VEIFNSFWFTIGIFMRTLETYDALIKYFSNIIHSVQTLSIGLKLTLKHLWEARTARDPLGIADEDYFIKDKGIATLQYPKESLPIPNHGRYKLHNEIEDCIVCDLCAKVCPVNCIEIEPIRATDIIGKTSDGTNKRIHAAKFDIDMSKCCFCGLCTTVCPTECLTMTKSYDFSTFDCADHVYEFAEMTPLQILEAKQAFEEKQRTKSTSLVKSMKPSGDKVVFKPKMFKPKLPKKKDD
tara:strand:+ start:89 stop:805 length:717 start_codon:yes stop_codon:yes gene_type:complete